MVTLVTGATGFLGRYLVVHLKTAEPNSTIHSCALNPSAELNCQELVDLTQEAQVHDMVQRIKPQRIYHLAGIAKVSDKITFKEYFFQNTLSTQILLDAVVKLKTSCDFFLASSVHVYGNQLETVNERSELKPEGPYGFTKLLAEETLKTFTLRNPQLRGIVARLYSCIGPKQAPGFVTSDICHKIKKLKQTSETTLEVGPVDSSRQFTDVRDAIQLFPRLFEVNLPSRFEIFNVATDQQTQVKELIEKALEIEQLKVKIVSKENHPNPFKGLKVDTKKLGQLIPNTHFRPLESSLKDILSSTPG